MRVRTSVLPVPRTPFTRALSLASGGVLLGALLLCGGTARAEPTAVSLPQKAAPHGAPPLSATYEIYFGGFHVLTADAQWERGAAGYRITGEAETRGMIGWLHPWKGNTETRGRVAGGKIIPQHHENRGSSDEGEKLVLLSYDPAGDLTEQQAEHRARHKAGEHGLTLFVAGDVADIGERQRDDRCSRRAGDEPQAGEREQRRGKRRHGDRGRGSDHRRDDDDKFPVPVAERPVDHLEDAVGKGVGRRDNGGVARSGGEFAGDLGQQRVDDTQCCHGAEAGHAEQDDWPHARGPRAGAGTLHSQPCLTPGCLSEGGPLRIGG